jgi:hypothetical protein
MKVSRKHVRTRTRALPELKFEDQSLTSFAGLVIFQKFFAAINLKGRLRERLRHARRHKVYGSATIFLQLIIHMLLGCRELSDVQRYQHDPLVKHILGLGQVPSVSTLSRTLKGANAETIARLRCLLRDMVRNRLVELVPARVTLDFDGSVQSTRRHAEGTAVGFNRKRKGARSYYPLFCTIAQLGQVFDVLHRPGNVHDSNGAREFVLACIAAMREVLPGVIIEIRMDSAFFSDELVNALDAAGVEFTISVPFERFPELKQMIEARKRWQRVDEESFFFEAEWKPRVWARRFRFLFIRTRAKQQHKGPVQLDLFEPHEYGYEFKVIVTNKTVGPDHIVTFHEGRGSQEGIFAELKTNCHLDYVPVRTLYGNQMYLLAGVFAHNLSRELQMRGRPRSRGTTAGRATWWVFETLDTLRKTLVLRAGRLTHPQNILTLTISATSSIKKRLLQTLSDIDQAV